ncbi:MAG: hypothetical protein J6A57_04240 [Ruminococcus sp.]|nr:hypothetical protein [Ruminococcus sp.]
MKAVSDFFDAPWAYQRDRENLEKYGTCDLDEIELIEEFAKKEIEKRSNEISDEKAEEKFNAKKDEFELQIIQKMNESFLIKKGEEISTSSPFVSDFVDVKGQRLYREDFVPYGLKRDPQYSDNHLELNGYNGHWQKKFKNKGPEYISATKVVKGYIINASALGVCGSIDVYIKGKDVPLSFKDGNFSTHYITKGLQLEDTSLDKKCVAEVFKRSLMSCPNIKFLTIPEHMGGNRLPDGSLTYVSAASVLPGLEAHFPIPIKEHKLLHHDRCFEEIVEEYKNALPNSWKVKSVVVDRVTNILLPFYEEEGLRPDRVKVISYENETTKHGIIAISKRMNYESTVVKSLTDRSTDVKADLASANDIPVVYVYNSTIEGRGVCKHRFDDICHDLHGENGVENPTRKIVTILTETPGSIPETLPANYLTIDEDIEFGDIVHLQRLSGQFDFSMIDFFYKNQNAARNIVHSAIEKACSNVRIIRNAENTQSMIMHLATATILKKFGLLTESELGSVIRWCSKTATSRTTVSDKLGYDIGVAVNRAICSGELRISNQLEPPYYRNDGKTAFIAEIDGSINVEVDTFERVFLANIKSTERRNLVLRALSEKQYLIPKKDYKRDFKVKFENGPEAPIRVYSLSSAILSDEARKIIDNALISDRFHAFDGRPDNFYPYIVHPQYVMVAGQVIKDYNTLNPFIAVTGSPGFGKTDFLMMQALQRAKADDVIVILDPTNSFCEFELREHKIPQKLIDEYFVFWDMSIKGFPIDLMDFSGCINVEQMTERLASLLVSGSHFTGNNQLSMLYEAAEKMIIKSLKDGGHLIELIDSTLKCKGKEGEVKRRLMTLFSIVAESTETPPGWDKLLSERGNILVISTGNATVKADCNPLDMIADHLYSYKDAHRAGNVTLILDEIQTMNLNTGAPIDILMSKGRKLNISAFLASQRYSNGKDKLGRLFDFCGTKIFFSPMELCIKAVSEKTHIPIDKLRCFDQGDCAFVGPSYSMYFGKNTPARAALVGRTYRPPYVDSYDAD